MPALLLAMVRSFVPASLDRVDQPLGDAAQAEPAGADRHAVEQQPVERCRGIGIHAARPLHMPRSSPACSIGPAAIGST
jgi:hypothetical protein